MIDGAQPHEKRQMYPDFVSVCAISHVTPSRPRHHHLTTIAAFRHGAQSIYCTEAICGYSASGFCGIGEQEL